MLFLRFYRGHKSIAIRIVIRIVSWGNCIFAALNNTISCCDETKNDLNFELTEMFFNIFAHRADQAAPGQGLLCLLIYDPTLMDLTRNFFQLCRNKNV